MSASTHAVAPPAFARAAAPPVQRRTEARDETQQAPQRLLASLSSVPSVQRKCATCATQEAQEPMPVQARLEVGPVDDPYEREADDIANRVMAMREPGPVTAADATVQRACTACSTNSDEVQRAPAAMIEPTLDNEQAPGMRPGDGGTKEHGKEHIAASHSQLTSGGSALPEKTRRFYESRMGRDLSAVRVHSGGDARALNQNISARAFTYRNHIWLGKTESDSPSFTMAHELAHVMQQTSPGPIGPASDAVMPRRRKTISDSSGATLQRRSNPFWLPREYTLPGATNPRSALSENSAKHDAAAKALAKANTTGSKQVLTEVMMPNATAGGTGCGICGFADLYVSDNNKVPGVELDCDKSADSAASTADPKTAKGLRTFNPSSSSSCTKYLSGRKQVHVQSRAPTLLNGNLVGSIPAITGMQIADMKPGHNESARKKGVEQINNYFQGLDLVRAKAKVTAGGENIWKFGNPKLMPKTSLSAIPDKWDPNKKDGVWPVNNLRLHMGPANDYSPGGVKGRWCIAPDNVNKGIWTYFLAPDPVTLAAALKTPASPPANFTSANAKITKIIGCLKATPKQKKAACKRPLPRQHTKLQPLAASRKEPVAQRKPLPDKDHFDLKTWNELRIGKGASSSTESLKTQLDKSVPSKIRDKIRFQGRAIESIDWMKSSLGVERKKPEGSKALLESKASLEQAMFWSGDTPAGDIARVLGVLRDRMGGLYVKVANVYERLSKKVKNAFKNTKFKTGSGSSLGKAAAKILGKIFVQLGKTVVSRTAAVIANCIESGFSRFMEDKVSGGLEQLTDQVDKVKTYVDDLTDDVVTKIESRFDEFVKSYEQTLRRLASSAKMVTKIVGTISEIVKIARMAFCASGLGAAGWGAIVTCLLSIADWIAGKFDKSPLDWVIKKVMNSCRGRRLFAQALFSFDEIKTLPEQLAKGMLTPIKAELPLEVQDLVCDLSDLKVEKLSMADFSCADSANEDTSDGEGDGDSSGAPLRGAETAEQGDGGGASGGAAQSGEGKGSAASGGARRKQSASASGGGDDVVVVLDPSSSREKLKDGASVDGAGVVLSGIDPKNPPATNSRVDIRVRISFPGYQLIMTQEIVFLGLEGESVTCYFPAKVSAASKSTPGPYKISETEIFALDRGPSHEITLKLGA